MEGKEITREYIRNFFNLSASEHDTALLDKIMPYLKPKTYAHNSFICRIGNEADEMFFIESGTAVVRGKDGENGRELHAGKYFGEYAAITGNKRLADIQAKGTVQVFSLDKDVLLDLTKHNSQIYAMFLQKVYEQSSNEYRKLVALLNTKRGLRFGGRQKKITLPMLLVNYISVFFVFLAVFLFAPSPESGQIHPVWLCSPIVFMVTYLVITQRAIETLILTIMYIAMLLSKIDFIGAFSGYVTGTIGEVADIIVIVLLMGSLTRLFAASGSINALKYVIQRKIKTAQGTFFTSFLSMVLIALDDYLSILINGTCFKSLLDGKKVPREQSAMVMGMAPSALCILSPLSVTGIFLTGTIILATGQRELFLQAVPYNFGAFIAIAFILLLIFQKLPFVGALKQAKIRVTNGGYLWPEGTDIPDTEDEPSSMGRLLNLILPVLILIVSSIAAGTLKAGSFEIDVLYGMIITMIFIFLFYCFQRYMTPEQFFKNMVFGIESMIAPVIILIAGKCFANGMADIGFTVWLNELVHSLIQGQNWLLPPIIFCVFALVGTLFDDPWAMFAIGIPIAAGLAVSTGVNIALYIGAVCAAGFIGNEIAPGNIFFIGSMLGVNPMCYYRAKLPYVIIITVITAFAYTAAGYFGL